ncbi:flagellar biosynthetic protein FliO [Jiella mangrovi]|uniref:Flagellar biosynthetic protein FliO n=1 Tax=Jiella mangrovi TaxID=2821407 RepID=A0ABS4BEU8_9HYPH|nr:flagellar biosynthetic protein FliO [Jiella mangrovi]MBP0615278.1 flagellar biosynthetic protein FliO [Jiella mangrovi]
MPQWIVDLFGASLAPIVWVAFVAAMVCLLAVAVILLAKRLVGSGAGVGPRAKAPRLQVIDSVRVDDKRKLVLLRRDEVEHLVLVGGQTDILVESSILRFPATRRPSTAPDDGRADVPTVSSSPNRRAQQAPQVMTAARNWDVRPVADDEPVEREPKAMPRPANEERREPSSPTVARGAPSPRAEPRLPEQSKLPPEPANSVTRRMDPAPTIELAEDEGRDRTARSETTAEARQVAVPSADAGRRTGEAQTLNPSTLAFTRATPRLPQRTEPELEAPTPDERPASPRAQSEPAPQAPVRAPNAAASGSNGQNAGSRASAASVDAPVARSNPPADRAGQTQSLSKASGMDADSREEPRPLSVRSFASAIQARKYGRADRPDPAVATPATPVRENPATGRSTSQPAARRDEPGAAVEQSLEDFLSAELNMEMQEETAPPPTTAKAPPRPAAAPAPQKPSGEAERKQGAPSTDGRQAEKPASDAGRPSSSDGAGRAQATNRPPAPAARNGATQAASRPGKPAAAPAQPPVPPRQQPPAVNAKPEPEKKPAPERQPATPPATPVSQQASEPKANPGTAPARAPEADGPSRQPALSPANDVDLEEEMKRLLGDIGAEKEKEKEKGKA